MKILAFSDIRTTLEIPKKEVDLVILLGNIPSKMVSKICSLYDEVPVLGLLSKRCHPSLYTDTSVVNIHHKCFEYGGLRFAGFGGEPREHDYEEEQVHDDKNVTDFIKQLEMSNVDVLITYTNPSYGDVKGSLASDGFQAYNKLILNGYVKNIIHGRIRNPFKRTLVNVNIESVYPFSLIELDNDEDMKSK
ncbi:metallophosphoesterase family protein [Lysinibacillus xylanilyticus]|uniref:metallophosphoesterase family protein n=1 Tax=Lysinibacillus xylanilyticus TaxID=582475 RepID=UPI003810B4BE